MTSQDAGQPAGLPCELFRFGTDGNVVALRIDSLAPQDGRAIEATGTIEIDCGDLAAGRGVRGALPTLVGDDDLDAWREALDALDLGQDVAWRADQKATEVHVRWEHDNMLVVTVSDTMSLLTDVTTAVPVSDEWFEEAYDRLDRVYELFERR
ncbi:DUF5959 family protein [Promicromonospora sp. NPDC060204]|uniref:DUF5959 family protein n=1 Tax=Promicromonospora sp. NPDC060204 TaxID=3347071 RepID=UPI00366156F6